MGCHSSKPCRVLAPGPLPAAPANAAPDDERLPLVEATEANQEPKTLLTGPRNSAGPTASKSVSFEFRNEPTTDSGERAVEPSAEPGPAPQAVNVMQLLEEKAKDATQGNRCMVETLRKSHLISKEVVEKAMLATDRRNYAPAAAYTDRPQPIGHDATISAPHMHAHALELLADHLVPGARALDIGCGSGYLSACMARMVGPEGVVIGVDHVFPLVELAAANVSKSDSELLGRELVLLHGDGWKGCPEDAPFDCIHVGAAAESVPAHLLEQLKPGGRMVIPVGRQSQHFYQIDRKPDGEYVTEKLMCVRYIPLVKTGIAAASSGIPRRRLSKEAESAIAEDAPLNPEKEAWYDSPPLSASPAAPEPSDRLQKPSEISEPLKEAVVQKIAVTAGPSIEPSKAKCCWCSSLACDFD